MNRFTDLVAGPTLWFLADWSLRWGVLIGVLAVWLVVFRPRRTATRYLVCCAVLFAGLCLPLTPRWGPELRLAASRTPIESTTTAPNNANSEPRTAVQDVTNIYESTAVPVEPTQSQVESPPIKSSPRDVEPAPEPLGARRVALLSVATLWLGGIAVYVVRWAGGCWLLNRMRRTATTLTGRCAEIFAECRAELGANREMSLATHPSVRSPLSLGIFRPVVIVPIDWTERSEHVQRSSLLHEIAHLARYDDWLAVLMETVRAAFWFHPLVRWLLARIECERELRCDETAISHGIDPRQYAQVLLEFARQPGRLLPAAVTTPSYPLRFGRRRTVKARIEHLLEDNMQRWIRPLSRGRAIALGTGVMVFAVGLGCARVTSRPKADEPQAEKKEERKRMVATTRVAPKQGHFIQSLDVLKIDKRSPKTESRLDLRGTYLVEPDGDVHLGPAYGRVKLSALYLDQAALLVKDAVGKVVKDADVSVTVVGRVKQWNDDPTRKRPYLIRPDHVLEITGMQSDVPPRIQLNGRYVVDADGRIEVQEFYGGRIKVAGLTLREVNQSFQALADQATDNQGIVVTLGGWEALWEQLYGADAKPPPKEISRDGRNALRYDGKYFDDWRRDLLTELKPEVRVDGIKAMAEFGAHGYGTEAAEVILEIMRGIQFTYGELSPENVLGICGNAIRRIGPTSVPVLLKGLKDTKANARLFAATSLMYVEPIQAASIPAIVDAMKDEIVEVRLAALTTGIVIDKDGPTFLPALVDAMKDKHPRVRHRAMEIVNNNQLGSKVEAALPEIIDVLKTKNRQTSPMAIAILTALGPKANAAVPELIESVNNPSLDRQQIIHAIRTVEPDKGKLAVALAQLLKAQARTLSWRDEGFEDELRALGGDAKSAVPTLIQMLKSGEEKQQLAAARVLGALGPIAKEALPSLDELKGRTKPSGLLNVLADAIEKIER